MHKCAWHGMGFTTPDRERILHEPTGRVPTDGQVPPEGGVPEVIVTQGDDGKTYTRIPRGARPDTRQNAWAPHGANSNSVHWSYNLIKTQLRTGLDERDKADLTEQLEALIDPSQGLIDYLETM
jgi:hypothetical protein